MGTGYFTVSLMNRPFQYHRKVEDYEKQLCKERC